MEGPSSKKEDLVPFKEPLTKSEFSNESSKIFELLKGRGEGTSEKVIRKADPKVLADIFKDTPDPLEREIKIKKMFLELEHYGIKVPVEFILSQEHSESEYPTMYIITDKIDGHILSKISEDEKKDFIVKLENLLVSLVDYLGDKLNNGGLFLWDIAKMNQFVYGVKRGETEKEIYLVDTEPLIEKGTDEIFIRFLDCVYFLDWAEKKFETRMDPVREKLKVLLDEFSKKIPNFKKYNISLINRVLKSE